MAVESSFHKQAWLKRILDSATEGRPSGRVLPKHGLDARSLPPRPVPYVDNPLTWQGPEAGDSGSVSSPKRTNYVNSRSNMPGTKHSARFQLHFGPP
jgi:hypothetical protein